MHHLKTGAAKLGIKLNPAQLEQFSTYYNELIDWNRKINLTSITSPEEVQTKHFLDSLSVAVALEQPIADLRFLDIGTGGGFPGLPLKIVFPAIKLALLEATAKKTVFLQHIVNKLGLNDVEVICGRAEELARQPEYREHFDIVLSRAVAQLSTLAELSLPFCTIGGLFIAQKSGDISSEIDSAAKSIETMGGSQPIAKRVELEELAAERYLIIINKTSPTPDKYPRRSGIPSKRPIL